MSEIKFVEDMFVEELKFELEQTDTICSPDILIELNTLDDSDLLSVSKKMGSAVVVEKINKITESNVLTV